MNGYGSLTVNGVNGTQNGLSSRAASFSSIEAPPIITNGDSNLPSIDGTMSPNSRSTTGKSGRVIEKLMAENDRLKRDLKVETTAKEEERRAREAIRSSRDLLQSVNDNLVHQTNVDKTSMARKDRKIEELKADRDNERNARIKAEQNLKSHVSETDNSMKEMQDKLAAALAERDHAVTQYAALQDGWKRLDDSYRSSLDKLKRRFDALQTERERDKQLLRRLEVTTEQQRQEVEKLRQARKAIVKRYEDELDNVDKEVSDIRRKAERHSEDAENVLQGANKTLGEVRHMLNVKKHLRPNVD